MAPKVVQAFRPVVAAALGPAALGVLAAACVIAAAYAQTRINPTDPQPTCNMCPGYYIPLSELQAYTKKAIDENLLDQQVRDIEIGKAHVGIGMVHRKKLDAPAPDSVAEHDLVSEVYHVVDGTATLELGPDIVNRRRRPATMRTVVEFNGPGNNGSGIRNGVTYHLKPGDVVVIPAGTGHLFTKIDDHIDYLMVRFDPDKATPIKDEAASKAYLSKPAPRGR
jgi:mannose-6-phosphate isomerase-like protein (cupin superfamily)